MDSFSKSPDQVANDAKDVGREAAYKATSIAQDAKQVASDAMDTGRAYAKDAAQAAGNKIDSFKTQLDDATAYCSKLIQEDPVKAVVITAVVSSLLTALVLGSLRTDSRYDY